MTDMTITIGEYTGWRARKPWCDGKQQFKSEGAAQAAVRSLLRREENGGDTHHGESKAYLCRTCGHWHHGRLRLGTTA